jgi:hypothetical protein
LRKLELLREHYKIPKEAGLLALTLKLAEEFVPGFRIELSRSSGRKRRWDPLLYTQLVADAESIKRERVCGDREACKILVQRAKTNPARYPYGMGKQRSTRNAVDTLRSRLVEARMPERNPLIKALVANDDERMKLLLDSLAKLGGPLHPL